MAAYHPGSNPFLSHISDEDVAIQFVPLFSTLLISFGERQGSVVNTPIIIPRSDYR